MGVNNIGNMAPDLAERLDKKDTKTFTEKSFHRSAATQLIEAGISIVNLYEASNQKSVSTARKYTEHSIIATEAYMNILDGKKWANDKLNDTPTQTLIKKQQCMKFLQEQ